MATTQPRLLLASGSPRRAQILREAGFDPTILVASIDESQAEAEEAPQYVQRLASAKAAAGREMAMQEQPNGQWVALGADTTVVTATGQLLGKPESEKEFGEMLGMLSGATHSVYTGWALHASDQVVTDVCRSDVTFRRLTRAEIAAYWRTGEPRDKAGGYAIQGLAAAFITRLSGSYANVVGLPIHQCATALEELGIKAYWK